MFKGLLKNRLKRFVACFLMFVMVLTAGAVLPERVEAAEETVKVWVVSNCEHLTCVYNDDGLFLGSQNYDYDSQKRHKKMHDYNEPFTYDSMGRVITEGIRRITYNENGYFSNYCREDEDKTRINWSKDSQTFTYDSSGKVLTFTRSGRSGDDEYGKYTYDDYGNMESCEITAKGWGWTGYQFTYLNSYKNGLLIKRTITQKKIDSDNTIDSESIRSWEYNYEYKSIEIPKSNLDRVKAQQYWLINFDSIVSQGYTAPNYRLEYVYKAPNTKGLDAIICEDEELTDENPIPKPYKITYNLNGGTGTFDTQTKTKDKTITLSKLVPVKKGYTFAGWATTKKGKVTYLPGDKYKKNKNLTLYAIWKKQKVTGKYYDGGVKKTLKYTAKYTDDYFTKNKATKVQGNLAKLSVLAASSAYRESHIKDLLEKCGFTNIEQNYNDATYWRTHKVSYTLAMKKAAGDTTIVAVIIRGTKGTPEWVSNGTVVNFNPIATITENASTTYHHGFNVAKDKVKKAIKKYFKNNEISGKIKFWVTGHSRGAAVANLLGENLTQAYGKERVYVYTFATPNASLSKKPYSNIFNYINTNDVVTKVPPLYKRIGKDITIKGAERKKMAKKFKKATGEKYDNKSLYHTHCQSTYIYWMDVKYA